MAGSLTEQQIETYRRDGIVFPVRVMSEAEAAQALQRFEALEAREGGKLSASTNGKPHILLPWLNQLVRQPRILDAVESLIGPNILCWASSFFAKNPGDGSFVTWHQDSTYWGLSSLDVVTAWVAFTPSVIENGCLRVIPGTHAKEQMPHRDTSKEGNLLSRGQEIAVEVDSKQALDVVLRPGEISLHHVRIAHGSEPNRSDIRRVGFPIRYIPTHIHQRGGRTTALLVRGVDEYGHFDPEPVPAMDFDPSAVAFHADSVRRILAVNATGGGDAR